MLLDSEVCDQLQIYIIIQSHFHLWKTHFKAKLAHFKLGLVLLLW